MPTRNVVLTDHLAAVVDGLVAKGRYQNASEAIREGVRLLEDDEARMDALIARLNRAHRDALDAPPATETGEEQVRRIFREAREAHEARQAAREAS